MGNLSPVDEGKYQAISVMRLLRAFGDLSDDETFEVFKLTSEMLLSKLDSRLENLALAAHSDDPKQVSFLAHQLKGGFNTLGGEDLADLCAEIEKVVGTSDEKLLPALIEKLKVLSQKYKLELDSLIKMTAKERLSLFSRPEARGKSIRS